MAGKVQDWTVDEGASLSDHRLITYTLRFAHNPGHNATIKTSRINVNKLDFNTLNRDIHTRLIDSDLPLLNAEDSASLITDVIAKTCERTAPTVKPRSKTVPWWSSDLTHLKLQMKRARKAYQNCCECRIKLVKLGQFRQARRSYKDGISKAKSES